MVAACAVMIFTGAGTASAGIHESIGFCKANEGLLCAAGNLLAAGTLKAHSPKVEFKNIAFFGTPVICESDMSVAAVTVMKNPIEVMISSLTFTNCTGPCLNVAAPNIPWKAELKMLTPTTYELFTKEFYVRIDHCNFGTSCGFGGPAADITLSGENITEGGTLKANGALEYQSGSGTFVCGSTLGMTGTYTASPAKSWYYTLLGTTNTES
jgi:hypothetical protein